jgi:hypothetical protein
LNGSLEQSSLNGRRHVRNENNQTSVKLHFSKHPEEVDAIVRHEREFVFVDPFGQRPNPAGRLSRGD